MLANRSSRYRRRGRLGFTLVELVIALSVTAIMAVIIGMTFMAQNRLYRRQRDIGRMQQNLRLAMEVVTKDLSLAGFGAGSAGQFLGALPVSGSSVELDTLIPLTDLNGDGRDGIYIAYAHPDRDTWGFVDKSEAGEGVASDYLCQTTQIDFNGNSAANALNFVATDDNWKYLACFSNAANTGLGVSFLWEVRDAPSNGVVYVHGNNQTDYMGQCPTGRGLPEEMVCSRLVQTAYYIDRNGNGVGPGTDDLPYLMISFDEDLDDGDDIPIAAGIEDMQFGYCAQMEDCDSFNWADREVFPTGMYFADISRVRVRMTARSEREEEYGLAATAPVALDPTTYNPAPTQDYYHRRVAHQVVTLRNARAAKQVRDEI